MQALSGQGLVGRGYDGQVNESGGDRSPFAVNVNQSKQFQILAIQPDPRSDLG